MKLKKKLFLDNFHLLKVLCYKTDIWKKFYIFIS